MESLCKCTLDVLEVCVWHYEGISNLYNCILLSQDSSEEKQNVHDIGTNLHVIHDNLIGGKSIATQPCTGHSGACLLYNYYKAVV